MTRFTALVKGLVSLFVVQFHPATAFASRTTTFTSPSRVRRHRVTRLHRDLFEPQHTHGLSMMLDIPRGGAALAVNKISEMTKTPSGLFNTALMALALTTATIKVLQRSTRAKKANKDEKPSSIKSLQIRFLIVFWLLRCADWLQGPYFYEVYASKVFNGAQASLGLISRLFLTGFASTALFGPIVGRASDQYGRKKGTLAFALLYGLGAASTKSPMLGVLFLGRILSGIGTSLLFSAPEAWLVAESQRSNDDPDGKYLGETFGLVSRHMLENRNLCVFDCSLNTL
jgi:hypothetical protein